MRRVTPALVGCLCLTLFASATALGARETRATVATATSAQLAASARGITPEARSAAKRHFVETQASSGRLVDASAVEVGSVDGVTFAWDAGITPPEITVRTVTDVATGETASQQIEATTSDTDTPERAQPLGGAGMGSIVTTAGSAALLNAACLLGTAPNGKMTWCYERFKVTTEYDATRDYYVSNRYSYTEGNTWTGFYDWRTSFNRIRTDPHPSYPGRVVGLGGFSPNSATQNCASSFGSLSVGAFSFNIPWGQCTITAPEPNAAAPYSMGVYYQGPVGSPRTRGLDFAAVFRTPQGGAAPVFLYTNQAQFCNPGVAGCTGGTWTN